jgi:hypothetical protein
MSPKQIIIVAIGVAVLAGGVGYVVTSIGTSGRDDGPLPPPSNKAPLDFWKDIEEPRYEESYTAGHHAFRYKNKENKPIVVGVNWQNCKCASVEICVAPDSWKALPDAELVKKAEDPSLEWTPLAKDGKGFTVPAEAIGWVRIGWKADKSKDERFKADLWLYQADSGIGYPLEIGVSFVDAVLVRSADEPDKVDAYIGRLGPGDQKEAHLLFWSSTRTEFTLVADPPRADPCLTYGAPQKLTAGDLDFLTQRTSRKALSGYRLTVTLRERAGDQQFDIGPFRREVRWKSDAMKDPIKAHVNGIVLGEVTAFVADSPDNPRLNMKLIHPDRPQIHKVRLETENPQVQLTLDESTCDFLKVEMLDGKEGKKGLGAGAALTTWEVNVSFRPDAQFRGRFPDPERPGYELTAIVFKINHAGVPNETPRRLRVLVGGQVESR